MIHVHGGSALLHKLRVAGLPGDFLEWCDVLCQGPVPGGLTADAFRAARAAFLAEDLGPASGRDAWAELEAQDRALDRALDHDEMVLWFGPELFCQAILMYLLAWLAERRDGAARRISLVCIGEYPGVDDDRSCTPAFLSAGQLRDVFGRRATADDAMFDAARRAWRAFTDTRPLALAELTGRDTGPLSYLGAALRRHLAELPATGTGLSLTERRVVEALAAREHDFSSLFPACQRDEERRWITDTILVAVLRRLASGPAPLAALEWDGTAGGRLPRAIRVTPLAREVLAGRRDWIAENGIDRWVGGVHLTTGNAWRWDRDGARVVAP